MSGDQIRDFLKWDIKSWSVALNYWDNNINWSDIQSCLELGGREGGLSLWLALKGKQVICSDLNQTKNNAEQLHRKYDVSSLIDYQDINATNIPYENQFDLIVFKSILGGIGRNNNQTKQQQVIDEIHKALKKGGKLLFAENLIASRLHRQLRKRFVNWGDSWRYVSLEEMNYFLRNFSAINLRTTGVLATLGRNEIQRDLLSSIDKLVLNKVSPRSWKYICYGIAEK